MRALSAIEVTDASAVTSQAPRDRGTVPGIHLGDGAGDSPVGDVPTPRSPESGPAAARECLGGPRPRRRGSPAPWGGRAAVHDLADHTRRDGRSVVVDDRALDVHARLAGAARLRELLVRGAGWSRAGPSRLAVEVPQRDVGSSRRASCAAPRFGMADAPQYPLRDETTGRCGRSRDGGERDPHRRRAEQLRDPSRAIVASRAAGGGRPAPAGGPRRRSRRGTRRRREQSRLLQWREQHRQRALDVVGRRSPLFIACSRHRHPGAAAIDEAGGSSAGTARARPVSEAVHTPTLHRVVVATGMSRVGPRRTGCHPQLARHHALPVRPTPVAGAGATAEVHQPPGGTGRRPPASASALSWWSSAASVLVHTHRGRRSGAGMEVISVVGPRGTKFMAPAPRQASFAVANDAAGQQVGRTAPGGDERPGRTHQVIVATGRVSQPASGGRTYSPAQRSPSDSLPLDLTTRRRRAWRHATRIHRHRASAARGVGRALLARR